MDAGTATVAAAGIAAWASVIAAVLHRTNGSGPLSKKIEEVRTELKSDICEVKSDLRDLKADFRQHLAGDGR